MTSVAWAEALDEYEAVLDRVERGLEQEDWGLLETLAIDALPPIEGYFPVDLEARLMAVAARGEAVRRRVESAALRTAELLASERSHAAARRSYMR